jgi:hypothetical protein
MNRIRPISFSRPMSAELLMRRLDKSFSQRRGKRRQNITVQRLIRVMPPGGGFAKQLTRNPQFEGVTLSWSPTRPAFSGGAFYSSWRSPEICR